MLSLRVKMTKIFVRSNTGGKFHGGVLTQLAHGLRRTLAVEHRSRVQVLINDCKVQLFLCVRGFEQRFGLPNLL